MRSRRPTAAAAVSRRPCSSPTAERVGDTDPLPLHPFGGPLRWDYDRPAIGGRVRAFYGNTGMFIRALAYILANGPTACARRQKTRC